MAKVNLGRVALPALALTMAVSAFAQPYRAPRLSDGHADLNGIWQALNEANYDLEAHMARPAMQTPAR